MDDLVARQRRPFGIALFGVTLGSWRIDVSRKPVDRAELARSYDRQSTRWPNVLRRYGFPAAYRSLAMRALEKARPGPQADLLHVLDAGIGTGAMAEAVADAWSGPIAVNGVDVSNAMLVAARQRLTGRVEQMDLRVADLTDLPEPSARFDLVLAAHVLEHAADPGAALDEAYRVLRPGGYLVAAVTQRTFAGFVIGAMWRVHSVAPERVAAWIRKAGFDAPEVVSFDGCGLASIMSLGYVVRKPVVDQRGVRSAVDQ